MENTDKQGFQLWQAVGWVILPVRFVQGWIFWAGGSRRFIYAPQKLDPYSANWLANKLQSAMPGALFGAGHIISYMLQHFWLLYISLILFSLLELLSGLGLILGIFSRLCAWVTAFISFTLLVNFGWEGATCLDEWTMAVSNFAMALVLILSGSPKYSIDNWLLKHYPKLQQNKFFHVFASGNWSLSSLRIAAIISLIFAILFTTGTYDYYRGAIFSPYHGEPVSPRNFQLSLRDGIIDKNGDVIFQVYVSGGTTAVPTYIMQAELLDKNGQILQIWTAKELSEIPASDISNTYLYNKIARGSYGLVAPVSAKATIRLAVPNKGKPLSRNHYFLRLSLIDGSKWSLSLHSQ